MPPLLPRALVFYDVDVHARKKYNVTEKFQSAKKNSFWFAPQNAWKWTKKKIHALSWNYIEFPLQNIPPYKITQERKP